MKKNAGLQIIIACLIIFSFAVFGLSFREKSGPVSIAVVPVVFRQGEPIIMTVKFANREAESAEKKYEIFINGVLAEEGIIKLPANSSIIHRYAYRNNFALGGQINFSIKYGEEEKTISFPPYPPQVWSSFVSFASFSTSVMSNMSSMTYYRNNFGAEEAINLGLIISLVLFCLLAFKDMARPANKVSVVGRLRTKFSLVSWLLVIIFLGMIFTKIVMMLK